MIIFNNVCFELNTDEVTLIWPLLEGFSLNVIFSEDMTGYVQELTGTYSSGSAPSSSDGAS